MKTWALSIAILAALPLSAAADTSKEDILKLAKAGISDDVILAFVRANGAPRLSSDDVIDLKAAGVSDKVLGALLSPRSEPRREDAPPIRRESETRVVEREVYVQPSRTIYVPSYSYYYDDCYYPYRSYSYGSCYPSYSFGFTYRRGWRGSYYRIGGCW